MQVEEEEEAEAVGRIGLVFSPIRIALIHIDVDDRYGIADANTPFEYWFPQNVANGLRRTMCAFVIAWTLDNRTERPLYDELCTENCFRFFE